MIQISYEFEKKIREKWPNIMLRNMREGLGIRIGDIFIIDDEYYVIHDITTNQVSRFCYLAVRDTGVLCYHVFYYHELMEKTDFTALLDETRRFEPYFDRIFGKVPETCPKLLKRLKLVAERSTLDQKLTDLDYRIAQLEVQRTNLVADIFDNDICQNMLVEKDWFIDYTDLDVKETLCVNRTLVPWFWTLDRNDDFVGYCNDS